MQIPTAEIVVNGRRKIVNADDPRVSNAKGLQPQEEEITRESVDKMKRAQVVGLLEAHGAPTDGKLPELRGRLRSIMFVDL